MLDSKYYAKAKLRELIAELDQAWKKPGKKPNTKVSTVLKKVLANTAMNNADMANMMPSVVKIVSQTPGDQLEIHKLACNYLVSYADAVPIEIIPILTNWLDQTVPLRVMALRTLLLINKPKFTEVALQVIMAKLADSDTEVRKLACMAAARVYQFVPESCEVLISRLNDMLLEDPDTLVVSMCLAALSLITEDLPKLSFALSKQHCQVLFGRMSHANEWGQLYILHALTGYVPQLVDEAIDLVEAVMPWLSSENAAVVLNAIKMIVYLNNYVPEPVILQALPQLPKRIGASLVSLLAKPLEIEFLVLRNAILILLGRKYLLSVDVLMFFCNYDDPIYVKDTKLEIIYLLADQSNVPRVLRELEEYSTEVDVLMARKAIRAFGNLAIKVPEAAADCVNVVVELINHGVRYIIQEAAVVIKNIVRKYPHQFHDALEELVKFYRQIDEPDAKASLLWMIGQYGETIDGSPKILAYLVEDFANDSLDVQYAALTAVVKLYLKIPNQVEQTMLAVLKLATEEVSNPDVRDRGFMYWNMITAPQGGEWQSITKQVVLNPKPGILGDNDNIDPAVIEELELNIGLLLLIYLKPVRTVFRLSKQKRLIQSPALQPRPLKNRLRLASEVVASSSVPRLSKFASYLMNGPSLNQGLRHGLNTGLGNSLPVRQHIDTADLISSSFDDSSPRRLGMMKRILRRIPLVAGFNKK